MKDKAANLNHFSFLLLKEQIKLNIAIAAGFLVIEMENDYKEKPLVKNNHFVSEREQDSSAHGWGMKIIEQIVEKYHGVYGFFTENKEFRFQASL